MTRTRPPQPQVSVIVPVYNQEQYLEECISSIRRQTLAEWECIIVNDGSSDSSGEIARRFSEEDSRIRCFEQENRGVSSARNLGMRHASGRYLCFVDGDDFIDAAFLKHLLDASDRGASDLTVAGKLFCDRFPPDKIPALPTCGIFLRREFLTAHCTAAECRRASLHLPFRLLLQSSGFSDFGRRLRRAGKNTGIRRKLLHFCPVPSWRRNGRAQLRQVREQLEEIRRNITF